MTTVQTLEQALGEEGAACLILITGSLLLTGLSLMLGSVGRWVVRSQEKMEPATVRRRAVELHRRAAEQRIAQIGEETRAAIRAAVEHRRRDDSGR